MGNVLQFKVVCVVFYSIGAVIVPWSCHFGYIGRGLVLMLSLMVGHDFTIAVYMGALLMLLVWWANDLFKLSVIVMCL